MKCGQSPANCEKPETCQIIILPNEKTSKIRLKAVFASPQTQTSAEGRCCCCHSDRLPWYLSESGHNICCYFSSSHLCCPVEYHVIYVYLKWSLSVSLVQFWLRWRITAVRQKGPSCHVAPHVTAKQWCLCCNCWRHPSSFQLNSYLIPRLLYFWCW